MKKDIHLYDNPPAAPTPDYVEYGISLCTFCIIDKCPIHGEEEGLNMTERESLIKRTRKDKVKACKLFTWRTSRVASFVCFLAMWACLFIDGEMNWFLTVLRVAGVAIFAWLMVYTNPDVDIGRRKSE